MAKFVIIGASAAGTAAIREIRALDREGDITLISEENHRPYSKVLLTQYIAGRVPFQNLFLDDEDFFSRMKVNAVMGTKAVRIDPDRRTVELENGRLVPYERLLLATGGAPSISGDLGQDPDVTGLRTISDAEAIKRRALEGAAIAISGGGLVGIKLACGLREAGATPELIVSSPHILSQVADDEAAILAERQLEMYGVRVRTGVDVKGVLRGPGGLEGISLSDGGTLPCRMLAVCKGVKPNSGPVSNHLPAWRGVRVDARMRTGLPGVFAAGDVAETQDLTSGEFRVLAIWPHAVAQGRIAGRNMAGRPENYAGSLPRNALEILGLPFISMGAIHVPAKGGDWDVAIERGPGTYRKLIYRRGRLVGAVLVGSVLEAGRLQAEIRRSAHFSPAV